LLPDASLIFVVIWLATSSLLTTLGPLEQAATATARTARAPADEARKRPGLQRIADVMPAMMTTLDWNPVGLEVGAAHCPRREPRPVQPARPFCVCGCRATLPTPTLTGAGRHVAPDR
jgi:hypothetical protein